MPTPVPPPAAPPPPAQRRFHLPTRQPWARTHERRHHEEALFSLGECAMFVLMWTLQDFEAGRVERCSRCQVRGSVDADNADMIFDTFKQPAEDRCPVCFGTTFEGGWKAKLVRHSIWDYTEEKWDKGARGYITNLMGTVQTTADFHLSDRDYIFRADGTRWRASGASTDRIHDGFGHPTRADSNLGYSYASVVREDQSSVAFEISPLTRTELTALLDVVGSHFPPNYAAVDRIRGPILSEMNDFEPVDYRPIDNVLGPPGVRP